MTNANPILIDVVRKDRVESRHRGALVVVNARGETLLALGDVTARVFPRSAIKPVQALPLLETGAADHFAVSESEIALACASHNGEDAQVAQVKAWLKRLSLTEDALACGAHPSLQPSVALDLARAHVTLGRAHNNCSGKHTGFLATALHIGEAVEGYERWDHPVQRRLTQAMVEMTGAKIETACCGVDGCGIPACAVPLDGLALAMARMSGSVEAEAVIGKARAAAAKRIVRAMGAHPHLVAGQGRADTKIMAATRGRVASKIGAEGVHVAIVPERGIGIAIKIDDGAGRAAEVAMVNVLDRLGFLDDPARQTLAPLIETPIMNTLGAAVGCVRAADALSALKP